jgi:hypothetical protein
MQAWPRRFPGTDRRESCGPDPNPARLSRWRYRKVKITLQIVDRPESQGPGQLIGLTSWMLNISDRDVEHLDSPRAS